MVLSNKSGFCHGVRTGPDTLHVCYCLAPARYIWNLDSYLDREQFGTSIRLASKTVAALFRQWDYNAAQRVDHFIAIINPPEAGILAVGSAKKIPVVQDDGTLGIGVRMKATISVDHRVSDGAEAAEFMQQLKQLLESPMRLLI